MTQSEQEIIKGLKDRDGKITQDFFFKKCRPLFNGIIKDYFKYDADYDELINCLYEHLMADNAKRLDQFHGGENGDAIYSWMRKTARNFFNEKKNREQVIRNISSSPLWDEMADDKFNLHLKKEINMDIPALLDQLRMKRDKIVIFKREIEEKSYDEISLEMGLSKNALYRIHNRAMNRLNKIARIALDAEDSLCAVKCEQYILDIFGIHKSLDELTQLSTKHGWLKDTGVKINDLGRIPEYFGLSVNHLTSDIYGIEQALKKNKQVLVAVDGGEIIGDRLEEMAEDIIAGEIADHCVVVLTCDINDDNISIFDPAYGDVPLTLSIEHFCDAWNDSEKYMIEVSR